MDSGLAAFAAPRNDRPGKRSADLRRNTGPDRAPPAGAAEPAIARRVLGKILLVIVLGEVELAGVHDLGRDRAVAVRRQRLVVHYLRILGGFALRRRRHIDAGTVLRADVVALAHALGRVVAFPEGLEQLFVRDLGRIVDHQHDLVVPGTAGADFLIGRVRRDRSRIAVRRRVNAVADLPEHALRAPEAAKSEDRGFEAGRI